MGQSIGRLDLVTARPTSTAMSTIKAATLAASAMLRRLAGPREKSRH
jgi:hypothetical protein